MSLALRPAHKVATTGRRRGVRAGAPRPTRRSSRPPAAVLAYGGGLDSFAELVDSLARGEPPQVVCFVDVGDPERKDPGEWPATYEHLAEVVEPLCRLHGIEFVWLTSRDYPVRDARSLFAWLLARRQIPVSGPNRICTIVAKVERFERWLADRWPDQVVDVRVGFEAGEEARVRNDPNAGNRKPHTPGRAIRVNRFPLIERGLCRCRCYALVRASGYPVPPGSACVFCPYASRGALQLFASTQPKAYARVVKREADKPPTQERGLKLSIMEYRDGKATPLPEFIAKPYRPRRVPCRVWRPGEARQAAGLPRAVPGARPGAAPHVKRPWGAHWSSGQPMVPLTRRRTRADSRELLHSARAKPRPCPGGCGRRRTGPRRATPPDPRAPRGPRARGPPAPGCARPAPVGQGAAGLSAAGPGTR